MKKLLPLLVLLCLLTACAREEAPAPDAAAVPPMPAKVTDWQDGAPLLDVYVADEEAVRQMPLEEYLCGVVAGEMRGDWPPEALRAQAILARTFALKFMTEKESKYEGADVSTDVEEAQAYDAAAVNGRIREAVEGTRGLVLSYQGELPYAWFHAHAGGRTAGAREGLNWKDEEPPYTRPVEGEEAEAMPWEAAFSSEAVLRAAEKAGLSLERLDSAEIGETGPSGRAVTLLLNGKPVSAADFRIAAGSTEMKSTLLTALSLDGGALTLAGEGYGHGVGMSQWGARAMAERGEKAEAIAAHYFAGCDIVKIY